MPGVRGIQAVDLMLGFPSGEGGPARPQAFMEREQGEFSSDPVQYLFKHDPDQRKAIEGDELLALMDQHGIEIGQLDMNMDKPERVLDLLERYPTRFVGSVTIDPNRGMAGVRRLEELVKASPLVKSINFVPCLTFPQVPINDKKAYIYYAKCIELDIVACINVGVPGPRLPMDCQNPYYLDEVCWFFPDLKVVMRHGGEPWTDLCVKLMIKWPNLYYSTSAFAPKYYPRDVLDFANKRGPDKLMYAGYFPTLPLPRLMSELAELPLRDHLWEPFLRGNANRVFKLGLDGAEG